MKLSFSKAATVVSAIALAITFSGMAYAAGKDVPLKARKVVTYLSRMLVNPTDSTDGTVRKAVSLTQSCKPWEVMQGFGTGGNLVCVPQISAQWERVATSATPILASSQAEQGNFGNFGCRVVSENKDNNTTYVMFCNSRTGRICIYSAFNDVASWQWSCDNASGFDIGASEYANCTAMRRASKTVITYKQYEYAMSCVTETGKICSYSTTTNSLGDIANSKWKCVKAKNPEIIGEFQ